MATPFTDQVIRWIRKIPKGKVATYGQIAKLTGRPNAARGVVWILNSCSQTHALPWHRVINSKGMIGFPPGTKNFREQHRLLAKDGVNVSAQGSVDLVRFQWQKTRTPTKAPRNKPRLFRE